MGDGRPYGRALDDPDGDPADLDLTANARCFRLGASPLSFGLVPLFYLCWLPVSFVLFRAVGSLTNAGTSVLGVLVAVPAVINIAVGAVAVTATMAAVGRERAWVGTQPFAIFGYRGLFTRERIVDEYGAASGRKDAKNAFIVRVRFAEGVTPPTAAAMEGMFGPLLLSAVEVRFSTMMLRCTVEPSSMSWREFRNVRDGVHQAIDLLLGVHETLPITRVCLEPA